MQNTRSKVSEAPVVMSARMIRGDHHHQCSVWIIVGNQCLLIEDHYHFNYRLMTLGQDAVYFRLIPHKAQPSFPLLVLVLSSVVGLKYIYYVKLFIKTTRSKGGIIFITVQRI